MKIMIGFLKECAEFKISFNISFNNKNHGKMLKKFFFKISLKRIFYSGFSFFAKKRNNFGY